MKRREQSIRYEYLKDDTYIYPNHPMVENWRFKKDQEVEAEFCNSMAELAEKNGISTNDFMHLFSAVLRMLKSESQWA